jgi:hypothetical protein
MSRWFRFYDEALDDPKVQTLPPALFKIWVNLLCLASKNDGIIPRLQDVAFSLRMTEPDVCERIGMLQAAGLLDVEGEYVVPHNWKGRQYKSDVSTERVQRFRKRSGNVSSAVSETPPDTDTEQIRNISPRARIREEPVKKSNNSGNGSSREPAEAEPLYSEAELVEFRFTFDLLDVEKAVAELSHWCDRKGITQPLERKNAIYGGLKDRQAKRRAALNVEERQTGPPVAVSGELLKSLERRGRLRA